MPPPQRHVGALPADVAAAVHRLAADAEAHDGVEALGEQTLLDLSVPGVTHLLVQHEGKDELLGYAQVSGESGSGSAELVVAPSQRRRGVGTALLAAVLDAADGPVAVWAHGNGPGAQALAGRTGLGVVRELWRMELDLRGRDVPSPVVPDGLTLRPFVLGQDEAAWLRVNGRAFADHPEQGRMTLDDVRARQAEPWFRAEDLLLLEDGEGLLAFAWTKIEPGATAGELYALGVDPDTQGRGLGRLLTAVTLRHLTDRGMERAVLYVSAADTVAVRTYTTAGFTVARTDVQYRR